MRERNFLFDTINYGLGGALPQLVGIIVLPIFTRYLTPEDYSLLELIAGFSVFFSILFRVSLPGAVARFYFDFTDHKLFSTYISTILFTIILWGGFVFTSIIVLRDYWIPNGLEDHNFYVVIVLPILSSFFSSFSDIHRRLLQVRGQSRYSLILSIVASIIGILLSFSLIVVFNLGATGSIISNFVLVLFLMIVFFYYVRKEFKFKFQFNLLKPTLSYSFGLFPSQVIGTGAPLTSKLFVWERIGPAGLSEFSIASKFNSAYSVLIHALTQSFLPEYYQFRKNHSNEKIVLAKFNLKIWLISCLAVIIFIFFTPLIIYYVLPSTYSGSISYLPLFSFGFLGNVFYIIYGQEIFYSKKTKTASLISFFSTLFNLIFVLATAARFGGLSLALGAAIGHWVSAIVSYRIGIKYFHLPIDKFVMFSGFITFAILVLAYVFWSEVI